MKLSLCLQQHFTIAQKTIVAGLALVWVLILGITLFSYWSWREYAPEVTPLLWMAIANSIAIVLLGGVSYLVMESAGDCEERSRCGDNRTKEVLWRSHDRLETIVAERTAALKEANHQLLAEIIQRRQIELSLRESESLYRTSIETIPQGIKEIDITGTITFANSALHRILGYPDGEIVGKKIFDLAPESERLAVSDYFIMVVKDQPPLTPYQTKALTKNSEIIDIQVDWNYKRNEKGKIIGFISVISDITQRQEREEALRQSELRFRHLAESLNLIPWEADLGTWKFTYIGPQAERIFGYPLSKWYQDPQFWISCIHPEDRDWAVSSCRQQSWLQENHEFEYRMVAADGRIVWVRDIIHVSKEPGNTVTLQGVFVDITESKKLAEKLAASEKLYQTMIRNFPNGAVALYDPDLRYTIADGKGLAEVGLSQELLEGKTIWQVFNPEVCQIIEPYYRNAFDGISSLFECPFCDRIYLVYILPVVNERGEISAGMMMTQDISDRKRVELALREERNFISAIFEAANALIVVLDFEGRIVQFNRACEEITGYAFVEVRERYFWDLFLLPEELEGVQTVFRELQSGELSNQYENYWLMRDGTRRLISWSNRIMLDPDGTVKYIIAVGIDITAKHEAEAIRRDLERQQELSQLRLRFFTLASHEFRTPLSTVLASAQLLLLFANEWPQDQIHKSISRIESAAQRMRKLLDDILTINRADTGNIGLSHISIPISQFCQKIIADIQSNRDRKPQITLSITSPLTTVYLDRQLLNIILNNLLNNAIKYSTPEQNINLEITETTTEIIFKVIDTGIGIPPSDIPHLFEAFYRGANVESIPGSGLGLTVVKNCVDLHGGTIEVTSQLGVGTTVTVIFPSETREVRLEK
ncbi:MAG TPA: hypothetical protein DDW56_20835 [Cyanobacteria bacterium UBA11366]|nr:hypothetical protein [Cyanobacteria bacterium UBA11366]